MGLEALLRWDHPERGVLAPGFFLTEAEENGVIVPIGQRVLDEACAFAARLRGLGLGDVPVSVNVSYREYSQPAFLTNLEEALARHLLPPSSLVLVMRIDGLIRNPAQGREIAQQLRAMGVGLSVDAFGTGLCDLGFLQQLSAAQVKLAHTTVHAAMEGGGPVIKSLIDIGHNLDMQVIGEAVETRSQLDFLRASGCDQAQGSWISEPLAADAAQRMLQARQPA
jgi:EAL domain-containing protein (putative c-di-GMP-specific phosphodiesterase class I)